MLKGFKVKVDDTDKSPGFKFSEQEMRGIPLRIEIGPRDIEAGKCIICRRDTFEKIETPIDGIQEKVALVLDAMQKDMLAKAKAHMDEMTYEAASTEDFRKHFENQLGFVKAMWCGEKECEEKIKEDLGVTSRCIPFEQKKLSDTCVCCGKPAKKMVIWAKAY